MKKKILNVGVISCSDMAQSHMLAVKNHEQACLAAVCDVDEEKLREAGDKMGVEARYTDYRELLRHPYRTVAVSTGMRDRRENRARAQAILEKRISVRLFEDFPRNAGILVRYETGICDLGHTYAGARCALYLCGP